MLTFAFKTPEPVPPMFTKDIINNNIPRLQLTDTVSKALQLMTDFRLTCLPVVENGKYLGLIGDEELLDVEDEKNTLDLLKRKLVNISVKYDEHFLNAVNIMNQHEAHVVPVVNDNNEYEGIITAPDLLKTVGEYCGANETGGIVVFERERIHFSLSEISRIAETNDITILHLNTIPVTDTSLLQVTIHLNKRELSTLVATFERFDYHVIYYTGNKNQENEIEANYQHLMNYLDI